MATLEHCEIRTPMCSRTGGKLKMAVAVANLLICSTTSYRETSMDGVACQGSMTWFLSSSINPKHILLLYTPIYAGYRWYWQLNYFSNNIITPAVQLRWKVAPLPERIWTIKTPFPTLDIRILFILSTPYQQLYLNFTMEADSVSINDANFCQDHLKEVVCTPPSSLLNP